MNIFWPETDSLFSARRACNQAASVAFLIAVFTAFITFRQMKGAPLIPGMDSASYLDAAVFLVLGIFMMRCSRIATVAALLLYAAGQIMMVQATKQTPFTGIFFSLMLLGGVRGAFAFQEQKKGLSTEEIKGQLKNSEVSEQEAVQPWQRVLAWIVLLGLIGGGAWWYFNYGKKPQQRVGIYDVPKTSQPVQITVPPEIEAEFERAARRPQAVVKSESVKASASAVQAPAQIVKTPEVPPPAGSTKFKLKDGRTISGVVIAEDPVYYTVKTRGGREEIVIKEDLAG